jgi:hypothetical protein
MFHPLNFSNYLKQISITKNKDIYSFKSHTGGHGIIKMNPSPVVLRTSTNRNHAEMTSDPIIFTARGLELDTCLNVLGQEFHVHSAVLKLKSNYFYRGMNFLGQIPVINGPFKYEWITKIDDDGSGMWSLTRGDTSQVSSPQVRLLRLPLTSSPDYQSRYVHAQGRQRLAHCGLRKPSACHVWRTVSSSRRYSTINQHDCARRLYLCCTSPVQLSRGTDVAR